MAPSTQRAGALRSSADVPPDPVACARAAGLRYVSDDQPGITRQRRGRGFAYRAPDGRPLRDPDSLARVRALRVPPAWKHVWICPSASGHLQATGRDARGRKQYRYHARFRQVRDETKFHRLLSFAAALPKIRAQTQRDLRRSGLPREKVLAAVVVLLEQTLIRIGNAEYRDQNQSFGLTTLRDRHAQIRGADVRFSFRGKSGKHREVTLNDARLAKIVKRCRDLPGDELFQYLDADGAQHVVDSQDVNEYLRAITSESFSAKDFRTWAGTLHTALALREIGPARSRAQRKRKVQESIVRAAARLGNTPSVCRKCYVHPAVLAAYERGTVIARVEGVGSRAESVHRACERALVALLRSQDSAQEVGAKKTGTLSQLLTASLRKERAGAQRRVRRR